MKKFIYFVAFLIVAFALTPWIDGFLFKKQFLNLVEAINRDNRIHLQVIDYRMGWLSSNIKINMVHATPNLSVKGIAPIELTLEETVTHGPIVYDKLKHKFIVAMAMIESHLHIPNNLEKLALGTSQPNGILQITTIASLGGNWSNHIQIPVLNIQLPAGGKMTWEGLSGESTLKVTNQQIDALNSDLTFGEFSATAPMSRQLMIKPISLSYNGIRHPFGLWVGKLKINIPNFMLKNANGSNIIYIENLSATTENNITANVFYNGSQQLSLQKLELPSNDIQSISFLNLILGAENFSAKGIANFSDFLKQANSSMYMANDVFHHQLADLASKTLTSTSVVNADVSFSTPLGGFLLKGKASKFISNTMASFIDIAKSSDMEVHIRIAIPLTNKLIESYFQTFAGHSQNDNDTTLGTKAMSAQIPGVPIATAKILDQASIEKLNQQIAELMKQGKLSLANSIQLMTFISQNPNLTPDQFVVSVKTLKLSPSIEAQIIAQYNQSIATAQPRKLIQSTSDTAKGTLDEWIRLGYLIQDKNDYVMSVLINNGEVKVNGKILQ